MLVWVLEFGGWPLCVRGGSGAGDSSGGVLMFVLMGNGYCLC